MRSHCYRGCAIHLLTGCSMREQGKTSLNLYPPCPFDRAIAPSVEISKYRSGDPVRMWGSPASFFRRPAEGPGRCRGAAPARGGAAAAQREPEADRPPGAYQRRDRAAAAKGWRGWAQYVLHLHEWPSLSRDIAFALCHFFCNDPPTHHNPPPPPPAHAHPLSHFLVPRHPPRKPGAIPCIALPTAQGGGAPTAPTAKPSPPLTLSCSLPPHQSAGNAPLRQWPLTLPWRGSTVQGPPARRRAGDKSPCPTATCCRGREAPPIPACPPAAAVAPSRSSFP